MFSDKHKVIQVHVSLSDVLYSVIWRKNTNNRVIEYVCLAQGTCFSDVDVIAHNIHWDEWKLIMDMNKYKLLAI